MITLLWNSFSPQHSQFFYKFNLPQSFMIYNLILNFPFQFFLNKNNPKKNKKLYNLKFNNNNNLTFIMSVKVIKLVQVSSQCQWVYQMRIVTVLLNHLHHRWVKLNRNRNFSKFLLACMFYLWIQKINNNNLLMLDRETCNSCLILLVCNGDIFLFLDDSIFNLFLSQ